MAAMSTTEKVDVLAELATWDVTAPGARPVATPPGSPPQPLNWATTGGMATIFQAAAGGGRCLPVFKVMQSNACLRNCLYCAVRRDRNITRCEMKPEELAALYMAVNRRRVADGLFLTSAITAHPDDTQERMIATARLLRERHEYSGYLHMKLLPGISSNAVAEAARYADRLSINLEAPVADHLGRIAPEKKLRSDLLEVLLTADRFVDKKAGRVRNGLCTQFVVGIAGETDAELLRSAQWLYSHINLRRTYYSAFSPIADTPLDGLPPASRVREHRLYQADFLLRDYGFAFDELPIGDVGMLPEGRDPKEEYALAHPDNYPVEVNTASLEELLRVPGIGPKSARRIVRMRRKGRLNSLEDLRKMGAWTGRARYYILLSGRSHAQSPLPLQHELALECPAANSSEEFAGLCPASGFVSPRIEVV